MDPPLTEFDPAAVEAHVRAYLAGNNRMLAIGECRTRLNCDFDAAHAIVLLMERLPYPAQEIRDAMQKVAMGQPIPSPAPSTETDRTSPGSAEGNRTAGKSPPTSDTNTTVGCVALLIVGALFLALLMGQCDSGPPSPGRSSGAGSSGDTSSAAKEPVEYQLALINKGGYVTNDDITITRFRYLLDQIKSKTGHSDEKIAAMTVKAQEILRSEYGKNVNLLTLMEESWQTLALDSGVKYEEILAATVTIRGKQ